MDGQALVLFDGVCNLCNGFVTFLIVRDKKKNLRFGSLQSARVKELLQQHHYYSNELSTVLLLEKNQLYSESTAVLKIFRQMDGAWPLLFGLIIVPRPLRDFLYQLIARNRYKIFGRRDSCMIPTPELRERFVE